VKKKDKNTFGIFKCSFINYKPSNIIDMPFSENILAFDNIKLLSRRMLRYKVVLWDKNIIGSNDLIEK